MWQLQSCAVFLTRTAPTLSVFLLRNARAGPEYGTTLPLPQLHQLTVFLAFHVSPLPQIHSWRIAGFGPCAGEERRHIKRSVAPHPPGGCAAAHAATKPPERAAGQRGLSGTAQRPGAPQEDRGARRGNARARPPSPPQKNVSLGDGHFQVMLLETLQGSAQGRRLIGEHDRVVHIEGGIFTVPEGMARQDIHFMLTAGM